MACSRYHLILVALAVLAGACDRESTAGSATDPALTAARAVDEGLAVISSDGIEAHLHFLASDALMGRMTGTPEYDEAADYVARQFEAIGLEPGGENGGWLQQVPMLAKRINVDSAKVVFHREGEDQALLWQQDFVMSGDAVRPQTEIRAEAVFVGFGVHAPEMNYSDYDNVDVAGKIVVEFLGAPPSFPHDERAYYTSGAVKAQEAVTRGAVGVILIRSREDQARYTWQRLSENAGIRPGMTWTSLSGEAANYFPRLQGIALINELPAARLFEHSPISYEDALDGADAGTPLSTPLGLEVTLASETDHESITSPNVIGILRGSDPRLADEYVIYTAHLDHIGTGVPVNGDSIYNGMYDNAMGSSILIETARAFASMPVAPKRSVVFIALTGEERGLVGSDYYAHYPSVPGNSMVTSINLDMPLFIAPIADLIAFGSEHSSLGPVIDAAISAEGLALAPDPMPEEVLFVRSDQYSFVKQGVPSVCLVTGFTAADPNIDGQKMWQDFLHTHYHQPSDDLTRPVDWPSAVRFARANVRIGYAVAEDEKRPSWNEGDFFGEKFGRQ